MKKMSTSRWLWLVASLLSLALMGPNVLGLEKTDVSPTILKIHAQPFVSCAPVFIAIEEGYFVEQGLEVELVRLRTSADALLALTQGQIDVVAGALSARVFNAAARGLSIKVVADKGHLESGDRFGALVGRKDLYESGQLRCLPDLRGKKLALVNPGHMDEYRLELMLAHHDVSREQVEIIYLGFPAMVQALQTGAIDAAILLEPLVTRVLTEGYGVVLAYYGDVHEYISPTSQLAILSFGPNFLRDHPALGRRFILAYLEGVRAYNQGKTPRNLEIMEQYTGLAKELLLQCGWTSIHSEGHLDEQSIMAFQDWLHQNGFIDWKVSTDEIIDTSFINWAKRVLSQESQN